MSRFAGTKFGIDHEGQFFIDLNEFFSAVKRAELKSKNRKDWEGSLPMEFYLVDEINDLLKEAQKSKWITPASFASDLKNPKEAFDCGVKIFENRNKYNYQELLDKTYKNVRVK